ncbi:endonuclease/exonuclease/phosphatase family protein [Geodermatophilus sp. YIM 151500]|uniref:endonuclease/exonuclease/phosphatase family protein n=1 Tax=Geodermatophilus sp. YIM 151500 TaxID=2984531 RepID=UPI0021E4D279|nr:endonuclease/exonuclease/phosphatase family protein [Geodermatophilus sp. YIM 151500]MCV2491216.1 endonuclease/exonuclease/phosphatase family protein [Geodermatophilus sp. YIM 151500]
MPADPDRRRFALAAAWPWVAWAVVRLAGAERGFPLVPAMAFTPYAAGTAVLPVLAGLRAGSPGATALGAGAAAALAAAALGRARRPHDLRPRTRRARSGRARAGQARAGRVAAGTPLRVATVSLRLGLASAEAVVDLVRDRGVDVLSVAELTPDAERRLAAAGLGDLLPHACVRRARAGSVESASGAVWSRLPLEAAGAVPGTYEQPTARLVPGTLDGGPPVEVTAVHSAAPATGPRSVRDWTRDLAALPVPRPGALRVLAGDFNATADHAAFRRVLAAGWLDAAQAAGRALAWTWRPLRLPMPRLTLDHVLVDPRITVAGVGFARLAGSDHRAVVADLRLPAVAGRRPTGPAGPVDAPPVLPGTA